MEAGSGDFVAIWIGSLKAGNAEVAQKPWSRYFEMLVRLSRSRLREVPQAVADEGDAAVNAFRSFVRGAAGGRFPRLDDSDDRWKLLDASTEPKAVEQAQHERRQKRGGKVLGM